MEEHIHVKRPSQVLAEQVKEWRRKRGLSAQQLADRIQELADWPETFAESARGGGLDRVAISKLENGQRGVSFDEALMLAAALNVPPALLILPLGREDRVAITSQSVIHPHLAWEWLAGEDSLASTDRKSIGGREYYEAAEPLRLFRALRRAQNDAGLAYSTLRRAEYVDDDKRLVSARADLADIFEGLGRVLASMREAKLKPPRMPDEWLDEAKRMGIDLEGDEGDNDGEH